ncbi:MAG: cation transporter [Deltaproteobacteria bacterium]|nr:cation transporter [Deltaproteobacteria bacterium]
MRFCPRATCDVVYFDKGGLRFGTADLQVPVFQKSVDPDRLVCYCFKHKLSDIADEVRRTGASTVPEHVVAQCKLGLDRCGEQNPQGSCCLANVRDVVKAAMGNVAGPGGEATPPERHDCCAPQPAAMTGGDPGDMAVPATPGRAGKWPLFGALVAAVLSSACCWLPLVLIGFGASAAGVAGLFEAYRIWLLGATALLLGAGFWLVYFRKEQCAPGDACAAADPNLKRLDRRILWLATAFVVAAAAFPGYSSALLGGDRGSTTTQVLGVTRVYSIVGMTCKGCATHIQEALHGVDGVAAVTVSYPEKQARVTFVPGASVGDDRVLAAIAEAGYEAVAVSAGHGAR